MYCKNYGGVKLHHEFYDLRHNFPKKICRGQKNVFLNLWSKLLDVMELSDQIEWCEITYQTHNEIVMMMGNDFMVMDRINHGANLSFSPPCFSMIEMISLQLQRDQKLQTKIRNPSFPKLPKRIMRHYTKCMFKVNCFHVKHTKFVSNFSIP